MNEQQKPDVRDGAEAPADQGVAPLLLNRAALVALARRLGVAVEKGATGVWLCTVELAVDELWLRFESAGGERVDVRVAEVGKEVWYGSGKTLKFGFKGKSLTRLAEALLARVRTALDGTPFAKLRGFVEQNSVSLSLRKAAEANDEKPGIPGPGQAVDCGPGYLPDGPTTRDWGHPDQWREFNAFSALQANPWESFLGHLVMGSGLTEVRHGDIECQDLTGVAAANPWLFSKQGEFVTEQGSGSTLFLTHIDDRDVVFGTGAKRLEGVLEQIEAAPGLPVLQFYNCCIPMMTGDDVRGALARFTQRTEVPVVYTDMSPLTCSEETTSAQFERRIKALAEVPAGRVGSMYNLVGFRGGAGRRELVELLAKAGAELNVSVLPEMPTTRPDEFGKASALAFMPNAYYERFYRMLEPSPVPRLAAELAPFGREGTLRWLSSLAQLIGDGVDVRLPEVLEEVLPPFESKWQAGVARAGGHGVALVVGPGDAARFARPALTGGVAIPRLLAEMGFHVNFLVYAGGQGPAVGAAELAALAGADARIEVATFATQGELTQLFLSGRFSAVYSNLRRDTRLTRAGLVGFALSDFDMGLGGALRTQQRLLSLCEVPFYRRHIGHLGQE